MFILTLATASVQAATVTVSVSWPSFSGENTVQIFDSSGTTAVAAVFTDGTNGTGTTFSGSQSYALTNGQTYSLRLTDSYGDGWNGPGTVTITVNGSTILTDSLAGGSGPFPSSISKSTSFTVPAPASIGSCSASPNIAFIIDDSGSIDNSERAQMSASIQQIADGIEASYPSARFGVVQYGSAAQATANAGTYAVSMGYSLNPTFNIVDNSALVQDHLPDSIDQMIADGLYTSGALANPDAFFIFTDATRTSAGCCSVLENSGLTVSSDAAAGFSEYVSLAGQSQSGDVSVFHVLPSASDASASMVQGDGVYRSGTSFTVSQADIDTIVGSMCDIATSPPVASKDYSDGPASYGSASHDIDSGYRLGATITSESSAVQNADNASDDGISITAMTQGTEASLTALVTGSGAYLNAWFDWNGDGDFADDGEQLLSNSSDGDLSDRNSSAGVIVQKISIPSYAASNVYARFRWSTEPVFPNDITETTKSKSDGEVEDYLFTVATGNAAPPGTQVCTNKTGAWSGSGSNWAASAGSLTVGATFSAATGASFTGASASTMNTINAWSDSTVQGASALAFTYNWDTSPENPGLPASNDAAAGVMSLSFSHPVTNPVIHIDRIGGTGYSSPGSAFIYPATSGASYTKLTGTPHFIVWSDRLHREVVGTAASTEESSLTPSAGTAAGSVAISGTYSNLNFSMTGAGVEGSGGDLMKVVVCATPASTGTADYGDAPASYGSPSHSVTTSVYLGNAPPDAESAAQSNSTATGDNIDGTDDEEGATVPTLVQGQAASLTMDVVGNGYLQGWIDWNHDGDFLDGGEQIATNIEDGTAGDLQTSPGIVTFTTTVPASAVIGTTYARFRWSTTPSLAANSGLASDGEVEDYTVSVVTPTSLSCAAVPATTVGSASLLGDNEFQLTPDANNQLGAIWANARLDLTQPFDYAARVYLGSKNATGADGLAFVMQNTSFTAQGREGRGVGAGDTQSGTMGISPSLIVELDTYSNADLGWNDPAEDHLAVYLNGNGRHNGLSTDLVSPVTLPNIEDGAYHDFRIVWNPSSNTLQVYFDGALKASTVVDLVSNLGTTTPYWGYTASTGGYANRHAICNLSTPAPVASKDYSDSPASYGSVSHDIASGFRLGATITSESSAVQNADNASDDGVSVPTLVQGQTVTLTANVTGAAYLQGWIDWNKDGDFLDAGEQVISNIYDGSPSDGNTTSGVIEVTTTVPSSAIAGTTYARFRWSNNGNLSANSGVATNGEVEDYAVTVSTAPSSSFPSIGSCVNDDTIWYNTQTELRTYNVSTGADTLQRALARPYGDIAWSPNGKLYGIEFIPGTSSGAPGSRVPGYRIYELSPTGSTESFVASGNEFDSVNSLAADNMGWLYFGSGHTYPSNPSYGGWNAANSRVYRINPGLASVELWIDFGTYGYTNGHPSGDYVFMDGSAYVAWTPSETAAGSSTSAILKVGPLDSDNKPTGSTTIVNLGASVYDLFGLTGNINGMLYGVSGSTGGLYAFSTSPYSSTFVSTLGGGPWGATQKSEGAGTVCAPAPDLDYSDAPADGVVAPAGGATSYGVATHNYDASVRLGATITSEPSAVADADNASDDGIDLSGLVKGSPKLITVYVPFTNGTDYLHGWVDWNGDGDFADSGEKIATNLRDDGAGVDGTFNDGQIQVMLNVPAGATSNTWARFRYSSDSGLGSTGSASDGEVEDYAITISDPVASTPIDPQACTGTNLLVNGDFSSGSTSWLESHRTDTSASGPMTIGLVGVNATLANAPWVGPNGDGVARSYVDNDGNLDDTYVNLRNETLLSITSGQTYNFGFDIQEIPNSASQSSLIGWALVDATTGAVVQQIPGVSVELDGVDKTGSYPLVTSSWQTFSQQFTATVPTGSYKVAMTFDAYLDSSIAMIDFYVDKVYFAPETVCDYSDGPANGAAAPAGGTTNYGTTRHAVVSGLQLGGSVTDETSAVTDADDASDNGVSVPTLTSGSTADVTIAAADLTGSGTGTLHAWIDFDGDGSFAATEYASVGFNNGASADLTFSGYGITMSAGTTHARFRITTDTLTNADAATAASNGEVEDYVLTIDESNAFSCDATLYQVANTPSILRSANFSGSSATFNDIGTAPSGLNGTWGYNTLDNYIYGVDAGTKDLWRVGADGVFLKIATVSGLADVVNNAGGISDSGELFAKLATSNNHWAVVDLADPTFPVLRTFTLSGAAANKIFYDVVWNPIDDMIYGVATDTSIIKVDTTTGVGTVVVAASGEPTLSNIAALWLTASNSLIGYNNDSNAYYSIDMTTGQSTKLSDSASSGGASDGAGCRGPAPIPTGALSGVVYADDDASNAQNGAEAGYPNIEVTMYFDNGTPADPADDIIAGTRTTAADGSYSFTGVNASSGVSYRVEVDTADSDLPATRVIGTVNPLTGLTVASGATTTADFGFDYSIPVIPSSCTNIIPAGNPTTHLAATEVTWNINGSFGSPMLLESVTIAGEPNTFSELMMPDSLSYQFATPNATNQTIRDQGTIGANITQGPAIFDPALLAANTDRDLSHYFQTDGAINNTDYVQFLYHTPVISAGNRYVLISERRGNNTLGVEALDNLGQVIGTSAVVSPATNIDTGAAVDMGQNVFFTVYPLTALAPSGTEISGIRLTQTGATGGDGGDGKVFILVDPVTVCVDVYDHGDAPATYGDARHTIKSDVYLGNVYPDAEDANQPSAGADADNNTDASDEDGVTSLPALSLSDRNYRITVNATNTTASPGRLIAWLDFDGNGTFDADEAAARVVPSGTTAGNFIVAWANIPPDIQSGTTYLRLRYTTDALNAGDATGAKSDGEVEDYELTIDSGGVVVSGNVYLDDNRTQTREPDEAGIGNTVMVLRDVVFGTCQSVTTTANGDYRFTGVIGGLLGAADYEVYQAHGETTPVPASCDSLLAANPTGYNSTTADVLNIQVNDLDVTDNDFGEIWETSTTTPENVGTGIAFEPDHQGEVLPGNVTFYAHVLTAEAGGDVEFSSTASGHAATGWTHVLYQDDDCNGILDGVEVSTLLDTAGIAVAAGDRLCIINKVYAPANVPARDRYEVTITAVATFDFSAGVIPPATLTVTDLTIVGQNVAPATPTTPSVGESRLELTKKVKNITQDTAETATLNQAKPGDVLSYRIYYKNSGTGPITDLKVNDNVPPFTGFISDSNVCDVTPPSMTCTANVSFDELNWTFTGELISGAEGHVSYEVMVDN